MLTAKRNRLEINPINLWRLRFVSADFQFRERPKSNPYFSRLKNFGFDVKLLKRFRHSACNLNETYMCFEDKEINLSHLHLLFIS